MASSVQQGTPHFKDNVRPADNLVHGSLSGDSNPERQSQRSLVTPLPAPVQGTVYRGAVWDKYLAETGLVRIFAGWIKELVKQEGLPYNPYALLTTYAQRLSEKFHMFAESDKQILQTFDSQVLCVGGSVFRTQDSPARWGLPFVLKATDAVLLLQYDQLLSIINTDVSTADYAGYTVYKPVTVLVGPCIFCGSLYPQVNIVHVRVEWSVAGPEFIQAVELFVTAILKDIHDIFKENVHILLGVTVPTRQQAVWIDGVWNYHMITTKEEDFSLAAVTAVAAGRMISAECMFGLEQDSQVFIRGQKQYNLNFTPTTEAEQLSPTAVPPYLSAFEGIFMSHSSAKEYMSWFAAAADKTDVTPSTSTAARGLFGGTRASSRNRRSATGLSVPSTATTSGRNSRPQNVTAESQDVKSPATGPLTHSVLESIRSHLQEEIAHFKDEDEFFKMLHCIILLLMLSRKKEGTGARLIEAARMLKSTAYKLHLVMEQNKVLQDLVLFFSSVGKDPDLHIVQSHFLSYRRAVKDLFSGSLHARSHDHVIFGEIVLDRLDSLTLINPHSAGSAETGTFPVTSEALKELKVINRYCSTVLLGLINDALSLCPNLQRLLPATRGIDNPSLTSRLFKHGAETMEMINQEQMFLTLENAGKSTRVPTVIAREAVLLQYMVDSRIDETFQEFLLSVLGGGSLPPNPFPQLVSHLRRAAVRMELFGVKRDRLISRLMPSSAQLVTQDSFVYHLPGSDAYGVLSAVSSLDGKHLNKLRSALRPLVNKVNARITLSGFKALVDVALSGFSPLLGRMLPYLHEVELEEHYFLQGPGHSRNEAIQHFCKLVCDHLSEYSEKEDVLFVGVFLGTSGLRKDLPDLAHPARMKMFQKQLVAAVKSKEPVSMRAYIMMDWRFVPVKKTFLLHYVHGQFTGYERFFSTNNPASFYQNVFSDKEVASLYARFCGPQHRGDPCAGENLGLSLVHIDHFIERAKEDGNLLDMYRWLLTRSLMNQHASVVPECWRMLHSVAAQLEYLEALNTTVQRIVREELSRTFRPIQEDEERQSLLDQAALGSTMEGYINKLEHVLQRATCMAPSGLLPRLTDKIHKITGVNPISRNLVILISQQTPSILQEMNEILEPLKMAASHDVHSCCPEIVQALESQQM